MASSSNGSVFSCNEQPPRGSTFSVLIALCYGVLIPMIIIGNGLVVTAFIINHKLRTATNIFICGLGLSDLLIGMFSVPYWTYISTLNSLMDAYCTPLYQVYICIDIGTGCASILQLTSIAIERLYFTMAPLKHRRLPKSVYWYMLAVAWIFAIFVAGLQPLQSKSWQDEYSVILLVSCFIFPMLIIVVVYLYILKVGRVMFKRKSSTSSRMGSTGGDIKEFNIFVTVIVITGLFAIAWAPFFVTTVVANFCATCLAKPHGDHLVRFVKWMQYSSSAINPYIYAYRNEDVRASFKKILRTCLCSCLPENKRIENRGRSSTNKEIQRRKPENDNGFIKSMKDDRKDIKNGELAAEKYQETLNFDAIVQLNTRPMQENAPRDLKSNGKLNKTSNPLTELTPYYDNKGFSEQTHSRRSKDTPKQKEYNRQRLKIADHKEALPPHDTKIFQYGKGSPQSYRSPPRFHQELNSSRLNPESARTSTRRPSKSRSTMAKAKRSNHHLCSYDNPRSSVIANSSYV